MKVKHLILYIQFMVFVLLGKLLPCRMESLQDFTHIVVFSALLIFNLVFIISFITNNWNANIKEMLKNMK